MLRYLKLLTSCIDVVGARSRGGVPRRLPLLYLDVTRRCNFKCLMCGYSSHYPHQGEELSTAELERIVREAKELGALLINVGGGEPFLRPDMLELLGHMDRRGITPVVHSNGALIDEGLCRGLSGLKKLVLMVSLDSHRKPVHDEMRGQESYDAVMSATRRLRELAPAAKVFFSFTITARNFTDIVPVFRLAREMGVHGVRFTPFHANLQHRFRSFPAPDDLGIRPDQIAPIQSSFETVLSLAHKTGILTNSATYLRLIPQHLAGRLTHKCYAGFLHCLVDPYGNMFPCYDHCGSVNIRSGGLKAAFLSPEMSRLRALVASCDHSCWNIGSAEPGLRLSASYILRNLAQSAREVLTFLPPS